MTISRQGIIEALALLPGWKFGRYDKSEPLYITSPDEGTETDIISAFKRDFQNRIELSEIGDVVNQLCNKEESISLKRLEQGNGYSGQIVRPLHYRNVKRGFSNRTVQEVAHPIGIRILEIHPDPGFGYVGNLTFNDLAGDLHSFLVAIDSEVYKEGFFVKHDSMGLLGEFLARTELKLSIRGSPLEVKATKMPLGCTSDDQGNLYGSSEGGIRIFGNIPTGQHELMFYAMDKRGNRSFALTKYEI